jgi:hypothetical protein
LVSATNGTPMPGAGRGSRATPPSGTSADRLNGLPKIAFARWISEPGQPDLPGIFRESMAELRGVLTISLARARPELGLS